MSLRHKHADAIIAWANGEEIEYRAIPGGGEWCTFPPDAVSWCNLAEYRIKPKEDTWTPCKSGKLRFVKRQIVKDINLISVTSIGQLQQMYTTSILQQLMVNQKAEYKWMDVPVEEEE